MIALVNARDECGSSSILIVDVDKLTNFRDTIDDEEKKKEATEWIDAINCHVKKHKEVGEQYQYLHQPKYKNPNGWYVLKNARIKNGSMFPITIDIIAEIFYD